MRTTNLHFLLFLIAVISLAASQSLTRTQNTQTDGPSTLGSTLSSTETPVAFSSRTQNTEIGNPGTTGTNAATTPGPATPVSSRTQNTEIGAPTTISKALAARMTGAGAVQVVVMAVGVRFMEAFI